MSASAVPVPDATRIDDLLYVRVSVESRLLEDLLETLAESPFPINPQIYHHVDEGRSSAVEFPAYDYWIPELRRRLARAGFDSATLDSRLVVDSLAAVH